MTLVEFFQTPEGLSCWLVLQTLIVTADVWLHVRFCRARAGRRPARRRRAR